MKKIAIPFLVSAGIIILIFLLFQHVEQDIMQLLQVSGQHKNKFALLSFMFLSADIVLPVPSSIVMYTNGYVLGLIKGMLLSFGSVMVAAVIGYFLGMYTSLGLKAGQDKKANTLLARYGTIAILVSRGIPILSESISIVCGYHKMPFKPYLLFNLLGYFPLCFLYALFGSAGYDKNNFLLSFACSLLVSAAFWFFGHSRLVNPEKIHSS